MSKSRTNKLYNYLVNTYGLSRETIMEHVEARLESLIDKHVRNVLDSDRVQNLIMDRIAYYIKNGEVSRWGRRTETFEKIVKDQIKSVVEDQLQKNCEVQFKFLPNSIQFIKENK